MVNLRKLEKIAILAFDNALRLHYDSIILYENKSYPSAYFLSILSQEEFGKMSAINEYVWDSKFNGGRDQEIEKKWLELLYKHPWKQHSFIRYSPVISGNYNFNREIAIAQEVFRGALEEKKQNAVYVGLKKTKNIVDINGRIRHPFQIKKKDAQGQITKINDYILVTGIGVRHGQFSLENESIEYAMKNKNFLNMNYKNWSHISRQARKQIDSIQKFFKEIVIPV